MLNNMQTNIKSKHKKRLFLKFIICTALKKLKPHVVWIFFVSYGTVFVKEKIMLNNSREKSVKVCKH